MAQNRLKTALKGLTWPARRKTSAIYSVIAYKFPVLPMPRRLANYSRYRPEFADLEHFDLFPLKTEIVAVHGVWAVDFITPSTLAGSVKNMKRVNWREFNARREGPEQWMESSRNIQSGGWRNLGIVSHNKKGLMPYVTKVSKFPKRFSHASFRIITVTPSLSAIVGWFHFAESERDAFMKIARSQHLPYGEPHWDGSISVNDPRSIKRAKVREIRSIWRDEITEFMARNFSSYFSTSGSNLISTYELIETDGLQENLQNLLFEDYNSWTTSVAAMRWTTSSNAPLRHSVLEFTTQNLVGTEFQLSDENDVHSLLADVDLSLPETLTMDSLHRLMQSFESTISSFRDEEFRPIVSHGRRASLLKSEKSREMADIALVSSELDQGELTWLTARGMNFQRTSDFSQETMSLKNVIVENLRERSSKVLTHHRNVIEAKHAINKAVTTFEMARIARGSFWVTIVSLMIAAGALYVSAQDRNQAGHVNITEK